MKAEVIDELEEIKRRLAADGIQVSPELLSRVFDDYQDMKGHVAGVRHALAEMPESPRPRR